MYGTRTRGLRRDAAKGLWQSLATSRNLSESLELRLARSSRFGRLREAFGRRELHLSYSRRRCRVGRVRDSFPCARRRNFFGCARRPCTSSVQRADFGTCACRMRFESLKAPSPRVCTSSDHRKGPSWSPRRVVPRFALRFAAIQRGCPRLFNPPVEIEDAGDRTDDPRERYARWSAPWRKWA